VYSFLNTEDFPHNHSNSRVSGFLLNRRVGQGLCERVRELVRLVYKAGCQPPVRPRVGVTPKESNYLTRGE